MSVLSTINDHTFHSHTERSGDLTLALNAPPHTPRNYTFTCTEIVAVHIGIDLDKLKVPPQSSLCYFRVGGLQLGPIRTCCSRHGLTFKDLMLESNCSSIDSPILFLACMYKSAIFAEESVVSHVGGRWLLVPYPELSLPFLLFLSSDDGSTPATLNL